MRNIWVMMTSPFDQFWVAWVDGNGKFWFHANGQIWETKPNWSKVYSQPVDLTFEFMPGDTLTFLSERYI